MTRQWIRFPLASAALAISLAVVGAQLIWHINLIELPISFMARIEQSETDDIVTLFLFIGMALLADQTIQARRIKASLEAERVRTIQATMTTVQDIVNDFMNQLQLLRLDANEYSRLEAIMFRRAVEETAEKLQAIGDIRSCAENQMRGARVL